MRGRHLRQRHRDPHQRIAAVRHASVRDRIFRPRADRGAAWAAGHAVRAQRDFGRGQRRHREARNGPIRRGGRIRIRQLRQHQGQGHDQRAHRRYPGRAGRGLLPQPRRIHDQSVRRFPDRRARYVCGARIAPFRADCEHHARPDGLLFPRERRPFAHPEAIVPARSDRRAGLPRQPARFRQDQRQFHTRDRAEFAGIIPYPGHPGRARPGQRLWA